ncbi:hypothetical protein TIFTF001_023867 [Ficus carica]|uniref:Uncharacterized protein n=1 Tax=Ficus carica TaxID=3494 RepID=A0AA88B0B6_FICCA|nr:hypothetical protein TIFTF001_023867 [Ficus carica]
MAFNKFSLVLLVLLVATILADASIDRFEASPKSQTSEFCSTCQCTEESGTTKCYRTDRKEGGCPLVCGSPCACTRSIPPICRCTYEVETCSPKQCPQNNAAKLEKLLTLNGNY